MRALFCWEKSARTAGQGAPAFGLFDDLLVLHVVRGGVVVRLRRSSESITEAVCSL